MRSTVCAPKGAPRVRLRHFCFPVVTMLTALVVLQVVLEWYAASSLRSGAPTARSRFLSRYDRGPEGLQNASVVAPRRLQRNRVFVSSIPWALSDGLGHRFAMVNFEMTLALELGLGYAHRRARYGSLTPPGDELAVERMFGWLRGVEPLADVLRTSCAEPAHVADACARPTRTNVVCRRLRARAAGGQFRRLVRLPAPVVDCFLDHFARKNGTCRRRADRFLRHHPGPDVMFQMTPRRCQADYRLGGFRTTGPFLRALYWGFHADFGRATPPRAGWLARLWAPRTSRKLSIDPRRINVAVHVRRGDFLAFAERQMIPDTVYADVVCEVKRALDAALGRPAPIVVSVYSEGVVRDGHIRNNHDVRAMLPLYATERGEVAPPGHWPRLLAERMARIGGSVEGIRVQLRIASSTVTAIHDMIAADFFVGSASGMTMQIVATYARGVAILPCAKDQPLKRCSRDRHLAFTYKKNDHTGVVHRKKLERRVGEAVRKHRLDQAA